MTNGNSNPPATTSVPPMMPAGAVTAVTTGTLIMDTYEIEKLINSGGMGEVYRGRNIHNGEPVAIKIVLPALAHDPKIVALFQKESTVLSRLSHDAIVRYHTFTIDRSIGRPCMVMEFVSGTPLAERIEQGPIPLDEVKVMFRRVASGLDKAHRAGVVHRDLSPDNVILEEGSVDHAKLIDFGIAKSASFGGGTLLGGQFAGKFNWVAPEQLGAFGGLVDGRSDIYSLALLVAAASRGKVVAMGDSIVDAVGKRAGVPDLTGVDPDLLPLLSYMLQPDPARRPDSMAAVIAALDNPALVPSLTAAPPDPNRTVIGGALPIAPVSMPPMQQTTATLPPAPAPLPVAAQVASGDWAVPADRQKTSGPITSSPATIIAPQPQLTQAPVPQAPLPQTGAGVAEPEDVSPFGAPVAPVKPAAVQPQQVPAPKKGKGGMLAVVGLLAVAGAAAGAYFGGVIGPTSQVTADQPPTDDPVPGPTQADLDAARIAAEKAQADARATAEAEAKKQADAAAAKAEADRLAAEAEAKAQAEAAARQAEQQAAANRTAEQQAAARKAAEAAAQQAAAAEKAAAEKAAADQAAADQAAAEAKAKADAEAAAADAAKAAEAKAAADEAARVAAESAADPMAAHLAWLAAATLPDCTHLRPATGGDPMAIDGFATSTAPLEQVAQAYKTALQRDPVLVPHLISEAQCPILGFVNRRQSAEVPALSVRQSVPGTTVKSGDGVTILVEGINGRPYAIFLFNQDGGTIKLKPFGTLASDGSASFSFRLVKTEGTSPAPQLVLVMATDTALPVLDAIKDASSAKALMPYIEVALKNNTGPIALGLGFLSLEN